MKNSNRNNKICLLGYGNNDLCGHIFWQKCLRLIDFKKKLNFIPDKSNLQLSIPNALMVPNQDDSS